LFRQSVSTATCSRDEISSPTSLGTDLSDGLGGAGIHFFKDQYPEAEQ